MDDAMQTEVSTGAPAGVDVGQQDPADSSEPGSASTEVERGLDAAGQAVAPRVPEVTDDGASPRSGITIGTEEPAHSVAFLRNVEVQASVELGRVVLPIGDVLRLAPGSVVHLDKMLGDPVDLMIKDKLVAKGEVVVVDDKFGLRITEIVSSGSEPAGRRRE